MPLLTLNLSCENVKYPAQKHFEKTNMLDDEVGEKDQVINLLASLPPSYDAFRSVLLARGFQITWNDVHQSLMMEDQQRELQHTRKESHEIGMKRKICPRSTACRAYLFSLSQTRSF